MFHGRGLDSETETPGLLHSGHVTAIQDRHLYMKSAVDSGIRPACDSPGVFFSPRAYYDLPNSRQML